MLFILLLYFGNKCKYSYYSIGVHGTSSEVLCWKTRAIQPHLGPFDDYCEDGLYNILEIKRMHHCVFVHMDL